MILRLYTIKDSLAQMQHALPQPHEERH